MPGYDFPLPASPPRHYRFSGGSGPVSVGGMFFRPRPRRAARVVILDPQGAVFLFRYDAEGVGVHWTTPGGGLEGRESHREAAVRELREETGWTDLTPGPLLLTWEHDYFRNGKRRRQHEHLFLAHSPRRDPVGDLTAAHAADGILAWRWWSPADLRSPAEPVWPPQLPALLADPPDEPVHLGLVPVGPQL
jgi:8-oxo-dGTP pyrophosphatase MutT (NUDIX family)